MIFKHWIAKYPYILTYRLLKLFRRPRGIVLYCSEFLDWEIFEPVQKYLKPIKVVSNKPKVRKLLAEKGIRAGRLPVFPKAVIMTRHSCDRFPAPEIIRIGMTHGAYHFKKLTKAKNYNLFNQYLFTSEAGLQAAQKIGVKIGVAVGYPKLDKALTGAYSATELKSLKQEAGIREGLPIIVFSSTWTASGMSALHRWIDRIEELKDRYNVIVTLHPWIEEAKRKYIRDKGIYVIKTNPVDYLYLAEIVVGDNSSLLGEACALNKAIITWKSPRGRRSVAEIEQMIASFSVQVDSWEEFLEAIETCLKDPGIKSAERQKANEIMYSSLDGQAGARAAAEIVKFLPELAL
ncbi:MAG TPA: CDP-glycerol glycerophosphotransferase family protein [Candidatus Cloacimonadota bacterium]|nr:CDP-glycerol glycerophosphotransferase family protein [Candidatus Cloacimonadota bacterium]